MRNNFKKISLFLLLFIIIVCIVIVIFIIYNYISRKKDSLYFKTSYESLNGQVRSSDGNTYNDISISENNPIKIINAKKATKILKNGTGVIYFGANWCPWCRTIIPILFNSASINNINTIYYVDIDTLKSGFEIKDDILIRNEENISDNYVELINALDKVLRNKNNEIKDANGVSYDTKEKSIHVPLVLTVKNGVITSYHNGSVTLNSNQSKYDSLTDEQTQNLLSLYNKMFETLK